MNTVCIDVMRFDLTLRSLRILKRSGSTYFDSGFDVRSNYVSYFLKNKVNGDKHE